MRQLRVPPDAEGQRLDTFLGESLGSRARAQRLIEGGQVRVEGTTVPKRHRVVAGERIEVDEEETRPEPEAEEAPVEIAFEDDALLVVDKAAGVVVHPARGHRTGTLAQALAGRAAGGGEEWRAGLVHRLDRDTSGLLVVAKSEAAHRALRAALASRVMRREYLALVSGRPGARSGTIDAPIGPLLHARLGSAFGASPKGRPARSHVAVRERRGDVSLVDVRIETGRPHQIRIHLAFAGHPLAGDPLYGEGGIPRADALPGDGGYRLHAHCLALPHPRTRVALTLECAPPPVLRTESER